MQARWVKAGPVCMGVHTARNMAQFDWGVILLGSALLGPVLPTLGRLVLLFVRHPCMCSLGHHPITTSPHSVSRSSPLTCSGDLGEPP